MLRPILIMVMCASLFKPAFAQQAPSADVVLKKAYSQASSEHKNVIVIFHASWCGWCHKLDSAMQDASCKAFFDANYITTHLTVLESPNKKQLENAGAMDLLTKYKGDKEGIPFFLIFDDKGNFLADSKFRKNADSVGSNMGCPATEEEVNAFLALLKKTSSLKDAELAVIGSRFRKNK